ncbi:hypothetical protein [Streptomyces sp. NPDC007346]
MPVIACWAWTQVQASEEQSAAPPFGGPASLSVQVQPEKTFGEP